MLDGDQIYTHSYMAAHKNGVRALFAATTKVRKIANIIVFLSIFSNSSS